MSRPIEKHTKLNHFGVKNSADMWRTFNGAHYGHWEICPSVEQVAAYRAAGVRCRRVKDELFVHHEDEAKAAEVDASRARARLPPSITDAPVSCDAQSGVKLEGGR